MADTRWILGISANETPEAGVWEFENGRPIRVVANVEMQRFDPGKASQSARLIYPTAITDALIDAVEAEGFRVRSASQGRPVDAVGISMPGNVDRERSVVYNIARLHYGPHFDDANVFQDKVEEIDLGKHCGISVPLFLNNDVVCVSRADSFLSHRDRYDSIVYVYIDTGVNVGVLINGEPIHSAMHAEVGHLRARLEKKPHEWSFTEGHSFCGFAHEGCFESILAKAALKERTDFNKLLDDSRPTKERQFLVDCISQLCEISVLAFAPRKITVGGYITPALLEEVRTTFDETLNGYPLYAERRERDFVELSSYPPDRVSYLGAAMLAHHGLKKSLG